MISNKDSNLKIASVTSLKQPQISSLRRFRSAPYVAPKPHPSEETPINLPFPPRRDDEPETDPLATPADTMPVISSVRSLHVPPPAGVKLPPGIKLRIVPGASEQSAKPKISVKSAAELASSQPKSLQLPAIYSKSAEKPQPVHVEVVASPSGQKSQMILTAPSTLSKYSFVQNGKLAPVLLDKNSPDQPFVLPIPNFSVTPERPLLVTGPKKKVLLVTNITKVDSESPPSAPIQPAKTTSSNATTPIPSKPKFTPSTLSQPRVLLPTAPPTTTIPPRQTTVLPTTTTALRQSAVLPTTTTTVPHQPAAPTTLTRLRVGKSTPLRNLQSIEAIKGVIETTRKRTRLVQKKVDFLRLKITAYDAFISQLVRKGIISKKAAKELRVLDTDVINYHNRRRSRVDGDTEVVEGAAGAESATPDMNGGTVAGGVTLKDAANVSSVHAGDNEKESKGNDKHS